MKGTEDGERGEWEKEAALELAADALLMALPRDAAYPVYTEAQLARHGETFGLSSLEAFGEQVMDVRPSQSFVDEVKFLAGVTPLTSEERMYLRGWLLGWTQQEMQRCWAELLRVKTQQSISNHLKSVLRKLYDARCVSFHRFSWRPIYRRPLHQRPWRGQVCPCCGESFAWGLGAGRYCSSQCREAAQRRKRR